MKKILIFSLTYTFLTTTQAATFPNPVAAAFYPIYNSGLNQYIPPDASMPFNKLSVIFVAFAHAYPKNQGAILDFENTQPDERNRLPLLVTTSHKINPKIKILISLGWEHNDWTYINTDFVSGTHSFVPSVIDFIRKQELDGFDIDDEGINSSSGYIPIENFNAVIKELKEALNKAGQEDGKSYYLTITPAFGRAEVNQENMIYFDLINTQNYGGSGPEHFISLGYPANQITQGINSESNCDQTLPSVKGYAGLFNWNFSADKICQYHYAYEIAEAVGWK